KGAWTITHAPADISVAPSSGSSAAGTPRTLTAAYFDPDGAASIRDAQILVNTAPGGGGGLFAWYSATVNRLYLRNNANTAWLGGFLPGSANTISDPA